MPGHIEITTIKVAAPKKIQDWSTFKESMSWTFKIQKFLTACQVYLSIEDLFSLGHRSGKSGLQRSQGGRHKNVVERMQMQKDLSGSLMDRVS